MATQTRNPGTVADTGSDGFGPDKAWVNVTNAQGATDSSFATVGGATSTPNSLQVSGWGFSIPAGSTINSFTLTFTGTGDGVDGHLVDLFWDFAKTSSGGAAETGYLENPEQLEQFPLTDSDFVGGSLPTVDELNTGEFWMRLYNDSILVSLDSIELEVDYTPPASGSNLTLLGVG